MAELAAFIGVAASVVGIASEGVKLSQTLNTYIAKVKYADRDVSGIANDVKETATVLVQLGDNLKLEEQSMICKPEFYETTNENVTSCEKIFKEIEAALSELVNIVVDEKGGPRSVELKSKVRFKWPFKRTQFTLLRTDLDRLKANLGLMISVMRHARELHEKEILDKQNAIGRRIETLKIQTLELETEAAEARFHDVKRRAEMAKEHLKSQQNVDDDDFEDCIDGATLNEDIERDDLNSSQQQPIPVVPMNRLTGQDYLPPPDRGTLGHGATNLAETNLQTGMGNADSNEGPRPETPNPSHKNRSYVEAATDWSKLEGLLVRIATAQEILAGSPELSVHQRQSKSRKRSDLQVHNHVKGRISGRPSDHQNKRSGKELPRASSEDDTDLHPGESGDNGSAASPENMVNDSRSPGTLPHGPHLPSRATHHLSTPLGVDPSNPAGLHQPIYHEQFEIGNVANLVVPPIPLVYNPAQDHLRILEAWVFRRADILKQSKDWGNVSRNLLPLDPQELNEIVSNQEKKGNKIWESFSVLSSYQQRQIQLLLYDKHCQFDHSSPNSVNRFVWTLKALKTDPKRAKTVDIRSIQIIIERKMQLGGQSQVTSIPYAPPVPLGHVGNSMQMHPVPRLRSHEASHRQQAHVSFAAEPADISQGPSRRTTYDEDFDRDSFMRRSRDNVKERSSSDTGPWDSQRGNSSSRPSYSENVALGAHAARKSSKEKKRMHKIKESILDLEDEMVDIDHRLEQRFDKLEDKLDKQLALRQTGSPIANRAQNGGLKESKLASVDGVYYSPAGTPLKALNSQPPLPSPDKFGVTVDSLLSKWTIVEGIHGNTAAPVNNSRVSLQRRSAPYLSSLHKSTTARRPSSRQRLSKSFKDNRQHTESGPRFSDSHMSSSDLIDDMD